LQSQVNDLWRTIPDAKLKEAPKEMRFPEEPQENILYFIEKKAPLLESWQRELVRIVRKISQYFYPQKQTQVMNEGWATFWHYHILNHRSVYSGIPAQSYQRGDAAGISHALLLRD